MVVIACILFFIFLSSSLASIPYLDGNIDLVKAYDFYTGGIPLLAERWGSLHPPMKLIIVSFFFKLFGIHAWSFAITGVVFGLVGIVAMYHFAKTLFGRNAAQLAALLLGTAPLFISVGIFSLIDYLLAVWALLVFLMYAKKKYAFMGVFLACAVLTKETGLLLPISILVVELCAWVFKRKISWGIVLASLAACTVYVLWSWYLTSIGQEPWGDWIFAETAGRGAMFTIVHNMITGGFINAYAKENWLHLFVLNYMWVYTVLAGAGIVLWRRAKIRQKPLAVYMLFCFFYTILVLSFQTYTIPRYVLPVVPLILLLASWCIDRVIHRWRPLRIPVFVVLACVGALALFTSTDPVSRAIWGDTRWMGERLYNLKDHLSGNDGITYNLQYFRVLKKRTNLIVQAQKSGRSIISNECNLLFADPNNESKMLKILSLNRVPAGNWCVRP